MSNDLKEFLERLEQKIDDYYEASPKGIPTCDVQDLYRWIDETKDELGIDYHVK